MNRVPLKIGSAEYQLKSEITCGGQGKVYTAINLETEEYIVVKIINLNEGAKWRYYTIETDAILDIEPWKHQYLVNYLYFCERVQNFTPMKIFCTQPVKLVASPLL